MTYHHQP